MRFVTIFKRFTKVTKTFLILFGINICLKTIISNLLQISCLVGSGWSWSSASDWPPRRRRTPSGSSPAPSCGSPTSRRAAPSRRLSTSYPRQSPSTTSAGKSQSAKHNETYPTPPKVGLHPVLWPIRKDPEGASPIRQGMETLASPSFIFQVVRAVWSSSLLVLCHHHQNLINHLALHFGRFYPHLRNFKLPNNGRGIQPWIYLGLKLLPGYHLNIVSFRNNLFDLHHESLRNYCFFLQRKVTQASERDLKYQTIMRNLVRRYVTQVNQEHEENNDEVQEQRWGSSGETESLTIVCSRSNGRRRTREWLRTMSMRSRMISRLSGFPKSSPSLYRKSTLIKTIQVWVDRNNASVRNEHTKCHRTCRCDLKPDIFRHLSKI